MFEASIDVLYLGVSVLLGSLSLLAVVAGAYGLSRLVKGQSVRQIAETAAAQIGAMKDFSDQQQMQIDSLKQHNTSLEGQVALLRDLVTQAAKVDSLRKENSDQHRAVMSELSIIKKAVMPSDPRAALSTSS